MAKSRTELSIFSSLVVGAALLHGYQTYSLAASPDHSGFVWSMLPYIVCVVTAFSSRSALPAIAAALVALCFDALAHYDVFINPNGSTAALALIFIPLWNTIVFVPLTLVIAHMLRKKRIARDNAL